MKKTEAQRRAENIEFLNQPPRFPLYENPDGSIGKIIPIGNNGGYIKINDASLVDSFLENHRKQKEMDYAFHNKLLQMGVKAYRANDGHVDRDNHKVTFFLSEKEPGWYWFGACNEGDKIFIGDRNAGGRFAIVTEVLKSKVYSWIECTYKPLAETLNGINFNGEEIPYLTPLTYKPTFWEKLFKSAPKLRSDICQTLD